MLVLLTDSSSLQQGLSARSITLESLGAWCFFQSRDMGSRRVQVAIMERCKSRSLASALVAVATGLLEPSSVTLAFVNGRIGLTSDGLFKDNGRLTRRFQKS
jgi:hypothetical protein